MTHTKVQVRQHEVDVFDYGIVELIDVCRDISTGKIRKKIYSDCWKDESWVGASREDTLAQILGKQVVRVKSSDNGEVNPDFARVGDSKLPTIEMDVSGIYPDVGEYLTGNPECMCNLIPQQVNKFIALFVDITASASFSANRLRKRGESLVSLIRALEDQGFLVKLDVGSYSRDYSGSYGLIRYRVKDHAEPIDDDLVSFLLGTPQAFHGAVFAHADVDQNWMRYADQDKPLHKDVPRHAVRGITHSFDLDLLEKLTGTRYDLALRGLHGSDYDLADLKKDISEFYKSKA